MTNKCSNCAYEGEEVSDKGTCPICGDNFVGEVVESNPLDLNGDGVVDKEDRSIAGKVLASGRKKKSKK